MKFDHHIVKNYNNQSVHICRPPFFKHSVLLNPENEWKVDENISRDLELCCIAQMRQFIEDWEKDNK